MWREIIHPALFGPENDISVKIIVILEACAFRAARIRPVIAPDSERTYTEAYPWFGFLECGMELFDKEVDVFTAPIGYILSVGELS